MTTPSIRTLRSDRGLLELVRQDIAETWRVAHDDPANEATLPIVAVDWSELFIYCASSQLADGDSDESDDETWSLQYAGLSYLLFLAPCKLLLLPPYLWEMHNYLKFIKAGAFTERIARDSDIPLQRFGGLLADVRAAAVHSESLRALLEGRSDPAELDLHTSRVLRDVIAEHLPDLFRYFQAASLEFLAALRSVLYSPTQRSRVISLADLPEYSAYSQRLRREHWLYWYQLMDWARGYRPEQNRADAAALAFLEQVSTACFWKRRLVLFATRGRAMRQVMSYHPGCFPSGILDPESLLGRSFSSVRSWQYFGEIAYYCRSPESRADLAELDRNIDALGAEISRLERGGDESLLPLHLREKYIFASRRWDRVRSAYNLAGLEDQAAWLSVPPKDKDRQLLAQVARLLVSKDAPASVRRERDRLAVEVRQRVDEILSLFPRSRLAEEPGQSLDLTTVPPGSEPALAVLRFFDLERELARFLPPAAVSTAKELLRTREPPEPLRNLALETLESLAGQTGSVAIGDYWLAGLCHYVLTSTGDAAYFFAHWRTQMTGKVAPGPALLTTLIYAETLRIEGRRRKAYQILQRPGLNPSTLDVQYMAIWRAVVVDFVLAWIEADREDADSFPYDRDGSVPHEVFRRALGWISTLGGRHSSISRALWLHLRHGLLYGVARILSRERTYGAADETPSKPSALDWITPGLWGFLFSALDDPIANIEARDEALLLDRKGYFCLKLPLFRPGLTEYVGHAGVSPAEARAALRESAVRYLERSLGLAVAEEYDALVSVVRRHLLLLNAPGR